MNEEQTTVEFAMKARLFTKMHAVLAKVGYVQKKGYNAFHKYHYAQEADILDHLRPLFIEHGIFFCVKTASTSREKIETVRADKTTKTEFFTTANLIGVFGDIETGYSIEIPFSGDGQDAGDKGIYKAYTGAVKYLLMKNFLLPTGDDPELDGEEEKAGRKEANQQAKAEALASQARLNREAEERQKHGEPLAELKHPPLPAKPLEALKKEMVDLMALQEISEGPFFSACLGVLKKIRGDWTITEYAQVVQYLKDMADGKLILEVRGGQGSFRRFEEPVPGKPYTLSEGFEESPQETAPVPKFKLQICQEIWMACREKAKVANVFPETILKATSGFITDEGKEKYLTLDDLTRATKETKWHKTTLRKLDIPEKEIPF